MCSTRLDAPPSDCFLAAHMTGGIPRYPPDLMGPCEPSTPRDQSWFNVVVRVRAHVAHLYMNGRYLGLVRTNLLTRGRVGVMCSVGPGNAMFFKNPTLRTKSLDYGKKNCPLTSNGLTIRIHARTNAYTNARIRANACVRAYVRA